jgi:hypothetical protein
MNLVLKKTKQIQRKSKKERCSKKDSKSKAMSADEIEKCQVK